MRTSAALNFYNTVLRTVRLLPCSQRFVLLLALVSLVPILGSVSVWSPSRGSSLLRACDLSLGTPLSPGKGGKAGKLGDGFFVSQQDGSTLPPLVFVQLGSNPARFPAHMVHTIRQAVRWNPSLAVLVVGSRTFLEAPTFPLRELLCSGLPENDDFWRTRVSLIAADDLPLTPQLAAFRATLAVSLDSDFLSSFIRFTAERLFVLDAALAHLGIAEAFHMENDNVLFVSLLELLPALRARYVGLAMTSLAIDLATAGFMYIRARRALVELLDFILLKGSLYPNEMYMLAAFAAQHPDVIGRLPTAPRCAMLNRSDDTDALATVLGDAGALAALGGFFDSAPYGQWLGGLDPIHGVIVPHYKNPVALYTVDKLVFRWTTDLAHPLRQARISCIDADSEPRTWWPLYTLHIHSKETMLFAS